MQFVRQSCDARMSLHESLEESVRAVAEWRNDSQTRDGDSSQGAAASDDARAGCSASEAVNSGHEIADCRQFAGVLRKTDLELVLQPEDHFDHGERIDRELVQTRRRMDELRRDFELLRKNLPQALERCVFLRRLN